MAHAGSSTRSRHGSTASCCTNNRYKQHLLQQTRRLQSHPGNLIFVAKAPQHGANCTTETPLGFSHRQRLQDTDVVYKCVGHGGCHCDYLTALQLSAALCIAAESSLQCLSALSRLAQSTVPPLLECTGMNSPHGIKLPYVCACVAV